MEEKDCRENPVLVLLRVSDFSENVWDIACDLTYACVNSLVHWRRRDLSIILPSDS